MKSLARALRFAAATAFVALAAAPADSDTLVSVPLVPTAIDLGWQGLVHHAPLTPSAVATLETVRRCDNAATVCASNADCAGGACVSTCDLPGGQCELLGPAGPRRCSRTLDVCTTNTDCAAGSDCVRFTGPPMPFAGNGTPFCILSYADGDITGTYDSVSGASLISGNLRWRLYFGFSGTGPCPRCGQPSDDPQVGQQFQCDGGQTDGDACTVDAVNPLYGGVSYECAPPTNYNISGTGLRIRLPEITTGATMREARIPCGSPNMCTDDGTACATNADCMRCTDGFDACTSNADCASGVCAAAPDQPVSCGLYCHCGLCDNDPFQPCFHDGECDSGESCVAGDADNSQVQPNACSDLVCGRAQPERCCASGDNSCDTPTPRVGVCSRAIDFPCSENEPCPTYFDAGTCMLDQRPCFEHRIERAGAPSPLGSHCTGDPSAGACTSNADCGVGECVAGTAEPRYEALTCVGGTATYETRRIGLPGPAALSFNGPLFGLPGQCGNGSLEIGEECDDGNSAAGDGCDGACDLECGDGVLNSVEECDDGNDTAGDCCAPDCTAEAPGGACSDHDACTLGDQCDGQGACVGSPFVCDDSDPCTVDFCDGQGGCTSFVGPRADCFSAEHSVLVIEDSPDDWKDRVRWRWRQGKSITAADLGDPSAATDYDVCIYDTIAQEAVLASHMHIPAGENWTAVTSGFDLRSTGYETDGVRSLAIRSGEARRTHARLRAVGQRVPLPVPFSASQYFAQDSFVVLQVVNSEDRCWISGYHRARRNDADGFRSERRRFFRD